MPEWYEEWFNEDYLALYAHRSDAEADRQVQDLITSLKLTGSERVLDLGCGAGRHVKAFCVRGYRVVGIDLSPTLVARAQEATNATIKRRDMRQLQGLGYFELITSFFTSFGYLPTPKDDCQVLQAVAGVLSQSGRFVLDTVDPRNLDLLLEEETVVRGVPVRLQRFLEDGCVIKKIEFPDRSYREQVRLYSRQELESMCRAAGLRPLDWTSENGRQLLVAQR